MPFTGRTAIGWITPCCLIEEASSCSSLSENARRGLRGLALRNSIGTLRCARGRSRCAASPPTSPIKLASPRPSRERASSAIASSLGFNCSSCALCRVGKGAFAPCPPFLLVALGWARFACPPYGSSPRLELALAADHFGGEAEIGFAAGAFQIVNQHRL